MKTVLVIILRQYLPAKCFAILLSDCQVCVKNLPKYVANFARNFLETKYTSLYWKKSMSPTLINFSDIEILGIANILKHCLSLSAIFLSTTLKLVKVRHLNRVWAPQQNSYQQYTQILIVIDLQNNKRIVM